MSRAAFRVVLGVVAVLLLAVVLGLILTLCSTTGGSKSPVQTIPAASPSTAVSQ